MVWWNTRNFVIPKPSCNLNNRYGRKYIVKRVISLYNVELELLPEFQEYLVFYINLLKSAATDLPLPGYIRLPRSHIKFDKDIEYEVFATIDFRLSKEQKRLSITLNGLVIENSIRSLLHISPTLPIYWMIFILIIYINDDYYPRLVWCSWSLHLDRE